MHSENSTKKIGQLVLSLMSHYWTAEDDPALRKIQARDWIEDLSEFPVEVVEEACRMWRRANKRRPTPHEIRDLALAENAYRKATMPAIPDLTRFPGCQDTWGSCAERWQSRGFICQESCRERIPGYHPQGDAA